MKSALYMARCWQLLIYIYLYFLGAGLTTTAESNANRTLWPLDGGSLVIDFHHPWTYVSFNLGLGSNTSTFTTALNAMLLNETGNGTLCIPKFTLPATLNIQDGQDASLQVITIGDSGTALYNVCESGQGPKLQPSGRISGAVKLLCSYPWAHLPLRLETQVRRQQTSSYSRLTRSFFGV